jgi:hypothetical protein
LVCAQNDPIHEQKQTALFCNHLPRASVNLYETARSSVPH